MKNLTENLIRRYLAALRDHLASRRSSGLKIACALGRGVMAEGQGTLALARMHDWALAELAPSHDFVNASHGLIRREGNFFAAALEPIEDAHQVDREYLVQFRRQTKALRLHTAAMARRNRERGPSFSRGRTGVSPVKKITVLLAEDHALVRQALRALLATEGTITVVGQAETGREAVKLAARLQPDVILMDIAMPVLNGLEATRQILATNPAARVLILSAHSEDEYIERLMAVGAVGFLEKQTLAEILTMAIREVARGKPFFSPIIVKRMKAWQQRLLNRDGLPSPKDALLSSRESEVLQLIAEGKANKQVAATLGISIKTVEKHRQHVMDKLNIHETAGLTRYAISRGIVESNLQVPIL